MFTTRPAEIRAGETDSTVVDCDGNLAAIIFPEEFNGDRVAFQISADNIDYRTLYQMDGRDVDMTIQPDGTVVVPPDVARAIRYLRLCASDPQSEDRTFLCVLVTVTAPARAATARSVKPRKTAKPRRHR